MRETAASCGLPDTSSSFLFFFLAFIINYSLSSSAWSYKRFRLERGGEGGRDVGREGKGGVGALFFFSYPLFRKVDIFRSGGTLKNKTPNAKD